MMIRTRSLLLPVLLLAAACSSVVREPEVRIESVRVGGIGLRGGTLYAQVYVGNPNGFDLETRSISYDMQVEHPDSAGRWVSFSQGTVEDPVRVRGNGSTIVEVPIQFRYDDLGGAVRSILDTGTFNYRVRGDVRLSQPIGRTIPYSKTGIVSLAGVRD
ncbi:MAG TPA: LEA type 2 family protein [Longimicrobiales bacterium]|nr:LEA type 2 family protein [Longimicrobiales bacterium]